jgi:uncharacterized delta-60 repeat protein
VPSLRSRRVLAAAAASAAAAAIAAVTPALAASGRPAASTAAALSGSTAAATPGTLDPSFGQGGTAALPAGAAPPYAVLLQADGKVLVFSSITDPANVFTDANGITTTLSDFGVLRYNSNGTLDTSFGTGGQALDPVAGLSVVAHGAFLQPDGKIVVAGGLQPVQGGPANPAAVLARFNANGTLDTSFGQGGTVVTRFPGHPGTDGVNAVLVQPDGKILAGGGVQPCVNPRNSQCASLTVLARYKPDGTLDATFGSGGVVQANAQSFGVTALGEDAAGDIFVQDGHGGAQPTLGEFSPAGVPQPQVTFSPPLTVATGFQPDGSYAVGQSTSDGTARDRDAQVVVKSLPAGAAVPGFTNPPFDYADPGANGSETATSFAFGPGGKIVAAGIHCSNQPARGACLSPEQTGVARLNAGGSLDTTFGNGGALTIAAGVDVDTLTVQPDGKILITWDEGSGSTPMFARLLG